MIQHLLKYYRNENEDKINWGLFNKSYEKGLEYYVVDTFKSLSEILPEIEMTDYSFNMNPGQINQSSYERTRSKKKRDMEQKYANIYDSVLGEVKMNFTVHFDRELEIPVNKNIFERTRELHYQQKILIPIVDENGYITMEGKSYIMQYQLADSSTFVSNGNVNLRSLLPVKIKKNKCTITDTNNNAYTVNFFEIFLFYKFTNILYFYFYNKGWTDTLEYFEVGRFIKAVVRPDNEDGYIYFKINNSLSLKVNKKAFFSSKHIQRMLGTIYNALTNRMSASKDSDESIYSKMTWLEKMSSFRPPKKKDKKESRLELGRRSNILQKRMIDESVKNALKLSDINKRDIFAILRWMVSNYDELHNKDNLNILNKRLKCNECIASLIDVTMSEKLKKFVNTTAVTDAKLKGKYDDLFSFKPFDLITKIYASGLMRYDEQVNDMDFFKKFKITMKGPNSMGGTNSKTIQPKYRGLDPSHTGKIEFNVCSASDPGRTNYIVPMCETNGLSFKDSSDEPEGASYNLRIDVGDIDPNDPNEIIVLTDFTKFNKLIDYDDMQIIIRPVNDREEK